MFDAKQTYKKNNWILMVLLFSIGIFILPRAGFAECRVCTPALTNSSGFLWGTATIEGIGDVQGGDKIMAFSEAVSVNEGCVGHFEVHTKGTYGAMAIYEDDPTTEEKDGVVVGDKIYFTVCHNDIEYHCDPNYIWDSPELVRLNLICPQNK